MTFQRYPNRSQTEINWPNLYFNDFQDLYKYNPVSSKNVYHFNHTHYYNDFKANFEFFVSILPFADGTITNVLDHGAGGGMLGWMLRDKYPKINVMSTIHPDFPYCEYMAERGQLCIFADAKKTLPFAKHSFDFVHLRWLVHNYNMTLQWNIIYEINRYSILF